MLEAFDQWMAEMIVEAPNWYWTSKMMHFRDKFWSKYRVWSKEEQAWLKRN